MASELYTIGHSSHELKHFFGLLEKHGVSAVCDVRSAPYSSRNPQFNREDIEKSLASRGIRYVFLGEELGARSKDHACYVDGQARYERIARTELFLSGIVRLRKGMERFRVSLMCAEADPLTCHRAILVCRQLRTEARIEHILPGGEIESHDEAERRLLRLTKLGNGDLFKSHDQLLEEAYRVQGLKIAYRRPESRGEGDEREVLR